MAEIKNETKYRYKQGMDPMHVDNMCYAHIIKINDSPIGSCQEITIDIKNKKIILKVVALKDGNGLVTSGAANFSLTTFYPGNMVTSLVLFNATVSLVEKYFKLDINKAKPEYIAIYKIEKIHDDPCKFFE